MGFLPTGVPNLDTILGGGIPEAYLIVVGGGPGTGKTVMVHQIASHHASQGGGVLYVTALSEPHTKLVSHLRGFRFFDPSLLGERIKLVNVFPVARQGLGAVTATILRTLKDEHISLLIFDGFNSLGDIHMDEREIRAFSYELAGTLSSIRATAIFTSDTDISRSFNSPETVIADGLIQLRAVWSGLTPRTTIEVIKMRGAEPIRGPHTVEITDRGVEVFPRPESVYRVQMQPPISGRATFGLREFDTALGGGLPRATATLAQGESGTGKTVLGLHFALSGTRRGEKSVILSFTETPEQLMSKSAAMGLDLRTAVNQGGIRILYRPTIELDPDKLVWDLWRAVEEVGSDRVIIDDLDRLYREVTPARAPGFLTAMAGHLQSLGATVYLTADISARSEGTASPSAPFSALADNLIRLRLLEAGGRWRRLVSITKMRNSAHDNSMYEYAIGQGGFQLGPPVHGERLG